MKHPLHLLFAFPKTTVMDGRGVLINLSINCVSVITSQGHGADTKTQAGNVKVIHIKCFVQSTQLPKT